MSRDSGRGRVIPGRRYPPGWSTNHLGAAAASAAATVVLGASFLPWARSGAADRSSYDLVASVRRLELLDGLAADLAPVWFLLPAMVGAAWLAVALDRIRTAATLGAIVGLLGVVLALQTVRSPLVHLPGAALGGGAGAIAIVAALAGWLPRRTDHVRSPPPDP
jgi:hypothetical protein